MGTGEIPDRGGVWASDVHRQVLVLEERTVYGHSHGRARCRGALEGLGQLLRNVALVKSNLNPDLDVRGIVLTMYDARTRLAVQVEREVREHFGSKVYRTVVPRTVRISEAPSFGEPIIVFDATSRGAVAYRELAKEVSRGATRRAG